VTTRDDFRHVNMLQGAFGCCHSKVNALVLLHVGFPPSSLCLRLTNAPSSFSFPQRLEKETIGFFGISQTFRWNIVLLACSHNLHNWEEVLAHEEKRFDLIPSFSSASLRFCYY
jgi:hypothetical protein